LDDKNEARAEGGRRFQKEGPITEKDLDMAKGVLVRGIKRGRKDEAESTTVDITLKSNNLALS